MMLFCGVLCNGVAFSDLRNICVIFKDVAVRCAIQ